MKPPSIFIEVLTKASLSDEERGEKLFGDWLRTYPELAPEKAGRSEPLNINVIGTEDLLPLWRSGSLLWKRSSRPRGDGTIWDLPRFPYNVLFFSYEWQEDAEWRQFFISLCSICEAEFAYIHLITDEEIAAPGIALPVAKRFWTGINWKDLEHGIPNLGWATAFSREMWDRFGLEDPAACPCEVWFFREFRGTELEVTTPNLHRRTEFEFGNWQKTESRERPISDFGFGC